MIHPLPPLIFATNSANKVAEIQQAFENKLPVISLKQAGIDIDIEEPYATLEENALEKCRVIYHKTGQNCFGEDTGLFVTALNGAPGVKSARYAGEHRSDKDNMQLLLQQLTDKEDRSAYFRTVVALIWNEKEYLFDGICSGRIAHGPKGSNGFGYDPLFVPDGSGGSTFAQMLMEEKNRISHRKKAMRKLVAFLMSMEK